MNGFSVLLVHFKDVLVAHPMFAAGLLLMAGYLIGKLAARVRLPEITGYIVAGLVMGKGVTGLFSVEMGESFRIVTEVALGLIALTIGAEFSGSKLRRIGSQSVVIAAVQIVTTFAAVAGALLLMKMSVPFALLLGAIATATAPAATVAVVQSLRARGPFIDYLYGIVALDDAGCVILFGVVFAFASQMLQVGAETVHAGSQVVHAFAEVGLSILIGLVSGYLLHKVTKNKEGSNEITILSVSIIFLTTAFAIQLHLSPLLTNMAAGSALVNLSARNHRIFRILEPLTPPVYALFFIIAGTELDLGVFANPRVLSLGLVYILLRSIGKYGGVWIGCAATKLPLPIRDNLGWCMLPQAGVAIGLVLLVQTSPLAASMSPELARTMGDMVNIVLLSVFVNELIGPPLSKYAIIRGNGMEDVR
jgi:Kef-type K+ transport system membrane component KefB